MTIDPPQYSDSESAKNHESNLRHEKKRKALGQLSSSSIGQTCSSLFGSPCQTLPANYMNPFAIEHFFVPTISPFGQTCSSHVDASSAFAGSSSFGKQRTFSRFRSSSSQPTTTAIGSIPVSSAPASGASSAPAFSASSTPELGAASAPAFGASSASASGFTSTSLSGNTSGAFGALSASALSASSTPALSAASTLVLRSGKKRKGQLLHLGTSSTPGLAASNTVDLSAPSTPTLDASSMAAFQPVQCVGFPDFQPVQDVGFQRVTPAFSASRTPASGVESTPSFFFGVRLSSSQKGSTTIGSTSGTSSSPIVFGVQATTPKFGSSSGFGQQTSVGSQEGVSRLTPFIPTPKEGACSMATEQTAKLESVFGAPPSVAATSLLSSSLSVGTGTPAAVSTFASGAAIGSNVLSTKFCDWLQSPTPFLQKQSSDGQPSAAFVSSKLLNSPSASFVGSLCSNSTLLCPSTTTSGSGQTNIARMLGYGCRNDIPPAGHNYVDASSSAFAGSSSFGKKRTFSRFRSSSSQSTTTAIGSIPASSTPASGASSTTALCASSTPACGASSAPAFDASSAPKFGAASAPAFGASSPSASGFTSTSLSALKQSSNSPFGQSSSSSFGQTCTSLFGSPCQTLPANQINPSAMKLFVSPTITPVGAQLGSSIAGPSSVCAGSLFRKNPTLSLFQSSTGQSTTMVNSSSQQTQNAFCSTVFGSSPAFTASSAPASSASSAPAFGSSSVPAFSFSSNPALAPAFGASSTSAFVFTSTSLFGNTSAEFEASSPPALRVSSKPALGVSSTPTLSAYSTLALRASSTPALAAPAFDASSAPKFGAASGPAFGASSPSASAFTSTSLSGAFGASSTPTLAAASTHDLGTPSMLSVSEFSMPAVRAANTPDLGTPSTPVLHRGKKTKALKQSSNSPFGQSSSSSFGQTCSSLFRSPCQTLPANQINPSAMKLFVSPTITPVGAQLGSSIAGPSSVCAGSSLFGKNPTFSLFQSSTGQSTTMVGSSSQQTQNAFYSTVFGSSPAFTAASAPASSTSSAPAFGPSSVRAFSFSSNPALAPAFGATSTSAFGFTSTSLFGNTSGAFWASSMPARAASSTPDLGAPSMPALSASSTPTLDASSMSVFQHVQCAGFPDFQPVQYVGFQRVTPAFSTSRTPAYGVQSMPSILFGVRLSPSQMGPTTFENTSGTSSSPIVFGVQATTPKFGSSSGFGQQTSVGTQEGVNRLTPFISTPKDGACSMPAEQTAKLESVFGAPPSAGFVGSLFSNSTSLCPSTTTSGSRQTNIARTIDYGCRNDGPPAGHNLFGPQQPHKERFVDREHERERIREEILREEARRSILEEELRQEVEMELYYGLRYPNLRYQGTCPAVQFQRPRFSYFCCTRGSGPRFQAPHNQFNRNHSRMREVQHTIMKINEEQLMPKTHVTLIEDKVKPCNQEEIRKKKDELTIQTRQNGNKVESNVSEISHKIIPPQTLLKEKIQSSKNQEESRPKVSLPGGALPKDKTKPPSNSNNDIEKEGDGNSVLNPEGGNNVEQLAFCQTSIFQELNQDAKASGLKRKSDSIPALSPLASTSGSTDKLGPKKAKKPKIGKNLYMCTLCEVTVGPGGDDCWLVHLNGKRHRNKLKRLPDLDVNKVVSSDVENKITSGIGLAALMVEMDKEDSLAAKPTGKVEQIEQRIIKKMQVGDKVHEVVEKSNRLWCEKCKYSCTTTVLMNIHLVSKRHKGNSLPP